MGTNTSNVCISQMKVYVSVKWKVNFLATHVPENNVPLALLYYGSAFEKRSPGRQMRPINAPGDPEPHHRWSGWRLVNSPKFRCWHSSSIVFKLFIGCPNQNYYKIMYTHYLSSWIYKLSLFFGGGGGGGGGGGVVPGDTICNITQFKFCLNLHICNDGSPRIGMGDPTTRLGWSVWRPRILIFQKHCYGWKWRFKKS